MTHSLHRTLLLVSIATGCGVKTSYVATNRPPHPMTPRSPETVEVITTGLPARPFVEVGLFEAQGRNARVDMEDLITELRAEAARVGCDAVVLTGTRNTMVADANAVAGPAVSTNNGYAATCIVFRRNDAASQTAQ